MANSRRQRRSSSTTTRAARRAAVADTAAAAPSQARAANEIDWQEEYAYVFRDLRHLTVISVAIFALLLIIGYFI